MSLYLADKLFCTRMHCYLFCRKILNELSSPVSVTKIDEESNSSQSQDGESQDSTSGAIQYSTATGSQSFYFSCAQSAFEAKPIVIWRPLKG